MSPTSTTTLLPDTMRKIGKQSNENTPLDNTLFIVEQPPKLFYKDEGGKSNYMSILVRLNGNTPVKSPISLRASLYFESELPVHDDSILNIFGNKYEPPSISANGGTAAFNFRIEKVGRRMDGQRFKLFIEPDPDLSPGATGIQGVFSTPIGVFSKRKQQPSTKNKPKDVRPQKKQRVEGTLHGFTDTGIMLTELGGVEQRIGNQMKDLRNLTLQLMELVRHQNRRILTLENAMNQQQQGHSQSARQPSSDNGPHSPVQCVPPSPLKLEHDPMPPQRPRLGASGSSTSLLKSFDLGHVEGGDSSDLKMDDALFWGGLPTQPPSKPVLGSALSAGMRGHSAFM